MNGKFPFAWDPQCLRNSKENGTSNRAFDEAFARQDGAGLRLTGLTRVKQGLSSMGCSVGKGVPLPYSIIGLILASTWR